MIDSFTLFVSLLGSVRTRSLRSNIQLFSTLVFFFLNPYFMLAIQCGVDGDNTTVAHVASRNYYSKVLTFKGAYTQQLLFNALREI